MNHQWYDDNKVYSDRTAFVWIVGKLQIIPLRTVEALASERVPDLILSYVFTHKMQRKIPPSSTNSNGNRAPLLL
jgi:hypothetical protein